MNTSKNIANHPIVLFDGVCNLCVGSVQFMIERDSKNNLKFASLQSEFGASLARELGADPEALVTLMLVENNKLYDRSTAALRIARHLRFPWFLSVTFLIVPPFIRNAAYKIISKNRYKWFGKKDTCMMPTPELQERFLS